MTVVELCMRLGNLHFLETQLDIFISDVLRNDIYLLDKLQEDFRSNIKSVSKKVAGCIC